MKTYIKPCIDEIIVEAINPIATSEFDFGNEPGDSQGAPNRKRVYIIDDEEELESNFGW